MADATRARVERLLEGLLADPALRAAFRRDPVRVCVDLDLPDLAAALARRRRGLETLEVRESRSPLGGALAAAAAEVSAAVDFIQGAAGPGAAPEAAPGGGGLAASGADGPRGELYRRGTFPAVSPDAAVAPAPAPAGGAAWPAATAGPAGVQAATAAPALAPAPVRSTLGGLAAAPGPRATLGGIAAAAAPHSTLGRTPALGEFGLEGLGAAAAGPAAGLGAVAEAQTLLGTPYVWGGKAPGGFDCSGLLQYVYARVGATLPRLAADQAAAGLPVPDQTMMAPGDIVYFDDGDGQPIHHVGMYVGGRSFIHAPHQGEVVKISSLDEPAYANRLAGARRVASGAPIVAAYAPAPPPAAPATLGRLAAAPAPVAGATLGGTPVAAPSGSTLGGVSVAAAEAGIAIAIDPGLLAYPGDGAPPEALAHWMAAAAVTRGLPPELPVMTSLAEAGLRNLPYGDRDSLGLFQQRPSQGWGTPEQVMNPYHALAIFLDRAAAADAGGRFSARGLEGLGDWSQAVQRSGFPERFGEQLPRAQALLATPAPAAGAPVPFAAPAPVAAAAPVAETAGQVEGAVMGGAAAAVGGAAMDGAAAADGAPTG